MKPKVLVKNAGHPVGLFGKMMIRTMNKEHSSLSIWGLDKLPEREYVSALDIGCGGGVNLLRLADFCQTVRGVDRSELSVAESKKRCKKLIKKNRAEVLFGSAEDLSFEDGAFDLVTAFETVYFWQGIENCFENVYRVLTENGVFLIVNELKKEKDRPEKYADIKEVLDLTVYDGEELTGYLSEAGFSDVTVYTEGENWLCAVAIK